MKPPKPPPKTTRGTPAPPKINPVVCGICKEVIQIVENELKTRGKEEIKTQLGKVCGRVPLLARSSCNSLVQNNTGPIVEGLINREPPAKVCQRIRLC